MENPHIIFDGLRGILKENKNTAYSTTDIDVLVDQIIESMSKWNTFFSILQKEHPTEEEKSRAQTVADEAVECHHDLVDNKTPKTHVAQYHSVPQYLRLHPGLLRKLIEHWVEQSHQTGHKIEQQFRHIPVTKRKVNCKAGK